MLVVQLVEITSLARPLETVVRQPSADAAVEDDSNREHRVQPQRNRNESSSVVERGFNRMHAGSRPSCRVVGLMMKAVDVPVQYLTDVRDSGCTPRVHDAMNSVKMRH